MRVEGAVYWREPAEFDLKPLSRLIRVRVVADDERTLEEEARPLTMLRPLVRPDVTASERTRPEEEERKDEALLPPATREPAFE